MANNHPRPGNMQRVTGSLRDAALRYCSVLELIKTAAAAKAREQLHAQLNLTTEAVQRAAAVKKSLKDTKQLSAHTDAGFINGLRGVADLLQIADPKTYERLPDLANLSKIEPDGFASAMVKALRGGGKQADAIASFIEAAMEGRFEAKKALVKAQEDQIHLNKGQASVSDLRSQITAADSLIHNAVEPGSPLLAMLKPPKKPHTRKPKLGPDGKPLPKKSRARKGDASATTTDAHAQPAHPTTPAPQPPAAATQASASAQANPVTPPGAAGQPATTRTQPAPSAQGASPVVVPALAAASNGVVRNVVAP